MFRLDAWKFASGSAAECHACEMVHMRAFRSAMPATSAQRAVQHATQRRCRRGGGSLCGATPNDDALPGFSESFDGQKNPVSGYKPWLPGGGLVHVLADVDPTATVEAAAVVQEGARIGRKCRIGSGSVVGPGVSVGYKARIGFQVALENCSIGSRCIIHHGAKIGGRGFVFRMEDDGSLHHVKEEQVFQAEIRENVEVGANTVIDRGSWRDTVVDKGAKVDSLVHIGHDATVGRACIICSGASVGASSSLGDGVVLGHEAAVKDHVSVAARSRIAAKSGVVRDIAAAGDYAGHPAVPAAAFKQQVATARLQRRQEAEPSQQPHADEFHPVT